MIYQILSLQEVINLDVLVSNVCTRHWLWDSDIRDFGNYYSTPYWQEWNQV